MVRFTLAAGFAMLASISSVAAVPFNPTGEMLNTLAPRQAQLPSDCTNYCSVSVGCVCIRRPTNCVANTTVQSGDTCGSIVSRFNNFTATDLYAWNPEIGQSCFGLQAYVPVCIGVTGYTYPGPVKGGDKETPDQTPVPVQPGIVTTCTQFEFMDNTGSPDLATILSSNSITKEQWNTWNYPTQNSTTDLAAWAGYFSCVKA